MANELVPDFWPPAPFTPAISQSARDSAAAFGGAGLDVGALSRADGRVLVLVARTPTLDDDRQGEWTDYDPARHLHVARMFARYGPGWSPKFAANTHQNLIGAYEQVESHKQGRPVTLDPLSMTRMDLEFDAQAQAALLKELAEITGQGGKDGDVETLRVKLADAIKAREDAEKKLKTREDVLLEERKIHTTTRKALETVLGALTALAAKALEVAPGSKGGIPARTLHGTGLSLTTLVSETRAKLGG